MFIYCACNKKQEGENKNEEKGKERRTMVNLIFSHVNPTFLPIGLYAFKHIHYTSLKQFF
jgi:hypothetical protein